MKDIDFDELDKAVNSLMATAPVAQSAPDETKPETTLELTPPSAPVTPPPVAASSAPAATTSAETITVSTTAPAAPSVVPTPSVTPAIKRSGRFMDMVHTSSDMKPRSATVAPSREGLSISPRSETASSSPAPVNAAAPETEPVSEPTTPDIMPDPLDMGNPNEPTLEVEPTPVAEGENQAPTVSGESPFIADAKVEKRPLNASASGTESLDSQLASELEADDTTSETAPVEEESQADEPPVTPQVPELSSDLVAIESNDKVEEPLVTQVVDTKDATSAVDSPAVPLGATSIAKQYRPQPSTGDQSHAAIYDASEYPEPVKHPAKKKSGWLWVLWVVLLLGVGAGIAVALYFLGIIP